MSYLYVFPLYLVHSDGCQNFLERVDGVVEPLLRGHVHLGDDDKEGQVQGHEQVQVLLGHGHDAGVGAHLSPVFSKLLSDKLLSFIMRVPRLLVENHLADKHKNLVDTLVVSAMTLYEKPILLDSSQIYY